MSRATIACKDDAHPMNLLTVIVLLPLAGFLLNGLLGRRLGRTFVSVVGCGLPVLALRSHAAPLLTVMAISFDC